MNTDPVRLDLLHQVWEMLLGIQEDPVALSHFDLDVYLSTQGDDAFDAHVEGKNWLFQHFKKAQPNCGTVGCAMGFAKIAIPELRENVNLPVYWAPGAIGRELGIDRNDAESLFNPDCYDDQPVTPQMVADRLQALINRYTTDGELQ